MEGERYMGCGQKVYGKYLCFPLFCCEPITSIKTKVNLFPKERRRKERREGRWEVGMEGRGRDGAARGK